MTPQPIIIKERFNWLTIVLIGIIILIIILWASCGGKSTVKVVQVADSAMIEENRRMKAESANRLQVDANREAMDNKLSSIEAEVARLVNLNHSLEIRLKSQIIKVITRTDSAACLELAQQANRYIDSAVAERLLREYMQDQADSVILMERGYSGTLRRLLDSCRGVIGVVKPAIGTLKPRNSVWIGVSGSGNLDRVIAGPSVMFMPKNKRWMMGASYQIGNSKPIFGGSYHRKISFRR